MKYTKRRTCIFNLNYHIIFCPKYRKPYLWKVGKQRLQRCFVISAVKHGAIIREIEIMPDHVHIFVSVVNHNKFVLTKFIQHIKGWSSYSLRKQKSWLKHYKALWAPSYFCESIGHISESTIRKYIKDQTTHMKSDYKYKDIVNAAKKRCLSKRCDTSVTVRHGIGRRYSYSGIEMFSFKNQIRTHRPQIPYFKESMQKNKGYI